MKHPNFVFNEYGGIIGESHGDEEAPRIILTDEDIEALYKEYESKQAQTAKERDEIAKQYVKDHNLKAKKGKE